MFTLILTSVLFSSQGISTTSVGGFESLDACQRAGEMAVSVPKKSGSFVQTYRTGFICVSSK